jgi:hypothetical protein
LTSDDDPFAGRPAEAAIFRLTRAQWGCVGAAVVIALWWLLHAPRTPAEPVAAVGVALCAVGADGRAVIDRATVAVRYVARSRWTYLRWGDDGATLSIVGRGSATCRVGYLKHRGRYDLSGEDEAVASALAALVDHLAVGPAPRLVTWHAVSGRAGLSTWLTVPAHTALPVVFTPAASPRHVMADLVTAGWLAERWRYVRARGCVAAVFAVRSVTPGERSTLAVLAHSGARPTVSVLVDVASTRSARAAVGKQAHRWRANVALSTRAGFRERATFAVNTRQLEQRERDVADGGALGRVAVYVVLVSDTVAGLEARATALGREALDAGVTLVRGNGRHAPWLCAALPGSPAWRAK